ncbi:DUF2157 domain-containing protein [Caulobacter sp. NIBR1757]|uniref:DUF2157 domain-containing protein n=1 Tax=Caulobacter sp. NIBR1757 TaxID=3016000 RepID=UPI0022F06EB0|nr:DUF2157 domain-containing protein [Caulobacter sp. NIBR1757]WGM39114.1 hypothetical protein AMEJIAPC_02027 [Caulobacter sp. NIBR1757]
MASYRERLTADLDRWIAAGLAPAENRQAMLDMTAEPRRLDAATTLALVGVVFIGAAVIAFVAANWDGIPRIGRFAILLVAFLAAAGGGAWTGARGRPNASNGLLTLAAALFAASIGLTGQIFDIAGDPKTALLGAAAGAGLLALVGRSSGALIAALLFVGMADFESPETFWLMPASVVGVATAWLWRSVPAAHAAGLAFAIGVWLTADRLTPDQVNHAVVGVSASLALAVAAFLAGGRRQGGRQEATIFYGWWVWAALAAFAGVAVWNAGDTVKVVHRGVWLLISGAVLALGRHERHALVTAAGVVSLMAAVAAVLFDLGLDLIYAAMVFGAAAVLVLGAGWLLRRRGAS